MQVLSG